MTEQANARTKIAVIGGGAWGTALASTVARAGHPVALWARDEDVVAAVNERHENPSYLPGISLPQSLRATTDLGDACEAAHIVLMAVPAQTLAAMISRCTVHIDPDTVIASCAKGIDRASGRTMSQIIGDANVELAVLSGPSFAVDVAAGLPTAVTIAAPKIDDAMRLSQLLSNGSLRCYASDDVVGVELGGALKNVLAIGVGIAAGRNLGASAQAALVSRGFAELGRLAAALGARSETLHGLSGLGDLVLTCGSEKSRNFAYGVALGRNQPLAGLKLAEGVHTAQMAAQMARQHNVDAPLIDAVRAILSEEIAIDDAIVALLNRPLKSE